MPLNVDGVTTQRVRHWIYEAAIIAALGAALTWIASETFQKGIMLAAACAIACIAILMLFRGAIRNKKDNKDEEVEKDSPKGSVPCALLPDQPAVNKSGMGILETATRSFDLMAVTGFRIVTTFVPTIRDRVKAGVEFRFLLIDAAQDLKMFERSCKTEGHASQDLKTVLQTLAKLVCPCLH